MWAGVSIPSGCYDPPSLRFRVCVSTLEPPFSWATGVARGLRPRPACAIGTARLAQENAVRFLFLRQPSRVLLPSPTDITKTARGQVPHRFS